MKKKIIIAAVIILLIAVIPIPRTYDGPEKDEGTKYYQALTYKIVKWNRVFYDDLTFNETGFYVFPRNFYSIDTIWNGMCIDPAVDPEDEFVPPDEYAPFEEDFENNIASDYEAVTHTEQKSEITDMHVLDCKGNFEYVYFLDEQSEGNALTRLYYYNIGYASVRTKEGTMPLNEAFASGRIDVDSIVDFLEEKCLRDKTQDDVYDYCEKLEYKDGGSVAYHFNGGDFTFIKKHRLNNSGGYDDACYICPYNTGIDDLPDDSEAVEIFRNKGKSLTAGKDADVSLTVKYPETVKSGENFLVRVSVTNNTDKTVTYTLPNCDYLNHKDIRVLIGSDGYFADGWDYMRAHPEALRDETLAPGETYTEDILFSAGYMDYSEGTITPAAPGTYNGSAEFRYGDQSEKVDFKIKVS